MDDHLVKLCGEWLPAWTGNNPEKLLTFYAPDAFYSDPNCRLGLRGHSELRPYFEKLLKKNPNWVWEAVEIIPTEKGAALKWKATIPVGDKVIIEEGLDIVEISNNLVTRNEVYFDRSDLLEQLKSLSR